jgi:anthranilate synthase/aminodeoxychorismate synthase-like glutamine amidotransferase
MIVLLDNYDSFTYNLYQVLCGLGAEVTVCRSDAISVDDVMSMHPTGVVISPGPGGPADAGISCSLLRRAQQDLPILGVCLGHQAVAAAFGGRIVRAGEVMHGKTSFVYHGSRGLLSGLPSPFEAVRYHSLVVDRSCLPACLEVTAQTADGTIMGLRHTTLPIEGVQFHPESILTLEGSRLLANFLARCTQTAPNVGMGASLLPAP